MEQNYCPTCNRETGYQRRLGWGTFFGALFTFGISLFFIPFYPKRCIVCGNDSIGKPEISPVPIIIENETKKCPVCAERIKLEAIKCRFCGKDFDPTTVAEEVKERGKTLQEKAGVGYLSQEGIQGAAFCLGCRTTGPRSKMLYNEKTDVFYHKECMPKSVDA